MREFLEVKPTVDVFEILFVLPAGLLEHELLRLPLDCVGWQGRWKRPLEEPEPGTLAVRTNEVGGRL